VIVICVGADVGSDGSVRHLRLFILSRLHSERVWSGGSSRYAPYGRANSKGRSVRFCKSFASHYQACWVFRRLRGMYFSI